MTQKQQIDYSEFYVVLEKIDKRITALEKDSSFIDARINSVENQRNNNKIKNEQEMKQIKFLMKSTNDDIKICVKEMIKLSEELKNTLKQEQIATLSEKIDMVNFNEFISRKDLKKKLKDI